MSKISKDQIKSLASLSKIYIDDETAVKLQKELDSILDYVEILNTVDTDKIEPTAQVTGLTDVTRQDTIIDYKTTHEDLMSNVPTKDGKYIKVKRVL